MINFYNAKKQFDENFRLFGNPNSQPEKYNLYAGLANLAQGLSGNQEQMNRIEASLSNIEELLKRVLINR